MLGWWWRKGAGEDAERQQHGRGDAGGWEWRNRQTIAVERTGGEEGEEESIG